MVGSTSDKSSKVKMGKAMRRKLLTLLLGCGRGSELIDQVLWSIDDELRLGEARHGGKEASDERLSKLHFF